MADIFLRLPRILGNKNNNTRAKGRKTLRESRQFLYNCLLFYGSMSIVEVSCNACLKEYPQDSRDAPGGAGYYRISGHCLKPAQNYQEARCQPVGFHAAWQSFQEKQVGVTPAGCYWRSVRGQPDQHDPRVSAPRSPHGWQRCSPPSAWH